ncbi:hypothetical protein RB594_007004 [Gaeumannomyces avenae]
MDAASAANINEISLVSPVACVNKDSQLRVYVLSVDGDVREIQYEGRWMGGEAKNKIGQAKLTSPLAATSLGLDKIRVYAIAPNNTISEFAYDSGKGWYAGGLSGKFKVAPYSGVAATFLAGKAVLRIYAQSEDNTIQEYCFDTNDKGWTKGTNFGAALPGTAMAATSWFKDNKLGIRVYYQSADQKVIEKCWDTGKGWTNGGLGFVGCPPRAPLGVVSWDGPAHIRLYYGTSDGRVREKAWDGSNWYDGAFDQASVPSSRVCALTVGGSNLRVYIQNGSHVSGFSEFAWSSGWKAAASPLPPKA